MANISLSQSLLDTDLSSLTAPAAIFSTWSTVINEIYALATGELTLDDEPTKNGNTYSRKNPSYSSELGTGIALGSTSQTFDSYGNLVSGVTKITGGFFDTGNGKGTLKGIYSETYSANSGIYSRTQNYTEFSFKGDDKSSWSLKGTYKENYSYNQNTEAAKRSLTMSATSVSSSDSNGNSIAYAGSVKYNSYSDEWEGYFTTQTITIGKSKVVSSGLKLTYDDLESGVEIGSIADMLPTLLAGNDVITLSSSDPIEGTVYGYDGNDKIIGSSNDDDIYGDGGDNYGNDTIDGGAGDDTLNGSGGSNQLTGGKGADTFVLSSNFIDTEIPKNTKITTITDFKDSEGDMLHIEFEYVTFKSLKIAAAEESSDEIVYESSTGKFWYDADGAVGTDSKPVVFAVCVGITSDSLIDVMA